MTRFGLLLLLGCSSPSSAPTGELTAAEVHPTLGALRVGRSTLDDVTKQFPTAKVQKDKSFGGTATLRIDGRPTIDISTDTFMATLIDISGTPRLRDATLYGPHLCAWATSHLTAAKCTGRDRGGGENYCFGQVEVHCATSDGIDMLGYVYLPAL